MKKHLRKILLFLSICILGILLIIPRDISPCEHKILKATFTNPQGNVIEYYVIKTAYRTADPADTPSLHTDAFRAVFDVDAAQLVREFDAAGHAAAIYQGEGCHYICCTTSPTASVVMAYDPKTVPEEDMVRSIRSIYAQ